LDTYHVVLYIHLLALLLGMSAGAIVSLCLFRLRTAQTLEAAAPWGMLAGQTERVFPFAILGLFATGAYLTSDLWTWGTTWIDVSIAGLVLVAVQGGGIAARRAHLLKAALQENGPGELRGRARKMTRDQVLWTASFGNLGVVLAIVWNMTEKPGTGGAVAAVLAGWAVAAVFSWQLTRVPAVEAETASEPA
jgi:hypothetical protein